MSETPELPPLPEPFHTYAMPWIGRSEPGPREPFNYFTPEQVAAYGRECWDAGRRAGLEEAAKRTPVAPWPDFAGQPIHHGDRLRHPSGEEFIAVKLHGYAEESDAWRAIYDVDSVSRLGLQIGDKGRAVVIRAQDKHQPEPKPSDLPVGSMLARGGCTETKWNMRRNSLMDGEYLLYAVRTTR